MKNIHLRDFFNTPGWLSLSRVPFGIAMIAMWLFGFNWLWITLVGLVGASTDRMDGYYARKLNLTSTAGELLDPLCDKFMLACASVIILSAIDWYRLNFIIGITLLGFEILFIIIPILAAIFTEAHVASLKPGKIRLNLECLGLICFYMGLNVYSELITLGYYFLFAALVFAVLTTFEAIQKEKSQVIKTLKALWKFVKIIFTDSAG